MRGIVGSSATALIAVCAVLLSVQALAKKTSAMKPNRVEIVYVQPPNPAHQQIYELLKERRVLERFRAYSEPAASTSLSRYWP